MAIHRPGERHRYHKILSRKKGKRGVTAILSLTAMVDMFTVLVIFLLQNYNSTGQILYMPKDFQLPKASSTKELKPAFVVTVSNKEILLDKDVIATFDEVKGQTEWMIQPLHDRLSNGLVLAKEKYEKDLQTTIKTAVDTARGNAGPERPTWNKVTIQADKGIDFLTVKKVMYTVTEAGAGEINFAVMKRTKEETENQ